MTEQIPGPRPRDPAPRKSILLGILGCCLLLAVVIAFYGFLFKNGLLPGSTGSATSTQTATPASNTTVTATPTKGVYAITATWPSTPTMYRSPTNTPDPDLPAPPQLPALPEAPTPPYTTDITPVLDSCRYALKPGKNDFLYSIYWKWGIYQKIPNLKDFYAGISCAGVPSNTACAYQASDPGTTMPGWVLILPGVSPNVCLSHGGTPVP